MVETATQLVLKYSSTLGSDTSSPQLVLITNSYSVLGLREVMVYGLLEVSAESQALLPVSLWYIHQESSSSLPSVQDIEAELVVISKADKRLGFWQLSV